MSQFLALILMVFVIYFVRVQTFKRTEKLVKERNPRVRILLIGAAENQPVVEEVRHDLKKLGLRLDEFPVDEGLKFLKDGDFHESYGIDQSGNSYDAVIVVRCRSEKRRGESAWTTHGWEALITDHAGRKITERDWPQLDLITNVHHSSGRWESSMTRLGQKGYEMIVKSIAKATSGKHAQAASH